VPKSGWPCSIELQHRRIAVDIADQPRQAIPFAIEQPIASRLSRKQDLSQQQSLL
jgi:hypothetical protein